MKQKKVIGNQESGKTWRHRKISLQLNIDLLKMERYNICKRKAYWEVIYDHGNGFFKISGGHP